MAARTQRQSQAYQAWKYARATRGRARGLARRRAWLQPPYPISYRLREHLQSGRGSPRGAARRCNRAASRYQQQSCGEAPGVRHRAPARLWSNGVSGTPGHVPHPSSARRPGACTGDHTSPVSGRWSESHWISIKTVNDSSYFRQRGDGSAHRVDDEPTDLPYPK